MCDAAAEVARIALDGLEAADEGQEQIVVIAGAGVGEGLLGEFPDALIRVELRGVGGETFQMQALGAATQVAHELAAMGPSSVPENDDVAGHLFEQLPQEIARLQLPDVLLIELEVEVEALANRGNRDAGDRRDPVAAVEVVDRGCLANGRPGLGHRGRQLEARFVGKDEMGAQSPGVFFTLGHSCLTKRRIWASLRSSAFLCGF